LYVFRKMPSWGLILCGLLLLAVSVPQATFKDHKRVLAQGAVEAANRGEKLSKEQLKAKEAWEKSLLRHQRGSEELEEEVEVHRSAYWSLFLFRAGVVTKWHSTYFYLFTIFDVGGMMLLGMAFMKMGIFSAECSFRFYWIMVILGYAIGLPLQA